MTLQNHHLLVEAPERCERDEGDDPPEDEWADDELDVVGDRFNVDLAFFDDKSFSSAEFFPPANAWSAFLFGVLVVFGVLGVWAPAFGVLGFFGVVLDGDFFLDGGADDDFLDFVLEDGLGVVVLSSLLLVDLRFGVRLRERLPLPSRKNTIKSFY